MSLYAGTQTPSLFAAAVHAVYAFTVARARGLLELLKNRRDAASLAGLDDRMLADIGLTRGDLRDAYSEPVWRDPTAILMSRSQERRVSRRFSLGLSAKLFEAPSIVPAPSTDVSARKLERSH